MARGLHDPLEVLLVDGGGGHRGGVGAGGAQAVEDEDEHAPPGVGGDVAGVVGQAAIHGYTTAFWWAAGIFFVGAVVSALVLDGSRVPAQATSGDPVFAH
ncbi:hypothetical protein C7Y72_01230 [Paraconexibacter algicola]|uniref:MFS transporter n=1 Tax=Paraconexibacter algicola TaxID=2133960 RepID=A0A2T4UGN5_9ACTN|nr:hypothetical protein C7Y72_01230 [Paraconexibacter algicola]